MARPGLVWHLFRRTARLQRKRMAMTVAAIAWGTISIVLLLSFGEGLKRNLRKNRRGMGEGIVVVWPAQTGKAFGGFPPGRELRVLAEDMPLLEANIPELAAACPEMRRWGISLSVGRKTLNKPVIGTTAAYGDLRANYAQAGGRFIDDLDVALKRRVLFLGDKAARELFGSEEVVGRTLLLNQVPFTVVGVMQKKRQMGMYGGPDENHVVIPITTFRAIFGRTYLNDFIVKARQPALTELAKKRVFEVLGGKYRFDPTDDRALQMWDTLESQKILDNITLGIELFLGIIGALTLVIGGVGVANIMYAVVKHRTREIGVQMALGARRGWILGPLVLESLALTATGGVVGVVVGVAIVEALAFVQRHAQSEALQMLGAPTFSLGVAATTVTVLGTIGFLAGYFPSRRAVRIQPAEALRYE
jgi:putative ABC transport system permease protein